MEPLPLARLSVTDPRAAARVLREAEVPRDAHWTMFLLVCVLGGMLAQVAALAAPAEDAVTPPALVVVALIGASIFLTMGIMILAGRIHGARAEPTDVLLTATWLQGVTLVAQAAALVVSFLVPPLAGLLTLAMVLLVIWMMAGFTAELFDLSTGQAGLGLLAAVVGLALLLAFLVNIVSALA